MGPVQPGDAGSAVLQIVRQPGGTRFRFFPAGADRALLTVSVPEDRAASVLNAVGEVPKTWDTAENVAHTPVFRGRAVVADDGCTIELDDKAAGISTTIACRCEDLPELIVDLGNATHTGPVQATTEDLRGLFASGPWARYRRIQADSPDSLIQQLPQQAGLHGATGVLAVHRIETARFDRGAVKTVNARLRKAIEPPGPQAPRFAAAAPAYLSQPRHRRHPWELSLIVWQP